MGVFYSNFLITLAGLPTAIEKSGMSFVTTEPAPITQPLPIVTPGQIIAFPPIQQSSPIVIGFETCYKCFWKKKKEKRNETAPVGKWKKWWNKKTILRLSWIKSSLNKG